MVSSTAVVRPVARSVIFRKSRCAPAREPVTFSRMEKAYMNAT